MDITIVKNYPPEVARARAEILEVVDYIYRRAKRDIFPEGSSIRPSTEQIQAKLREAHAAAAPYYSELVRLENLVVDLTVTGTLDPDLYPR